MSNMPSDERRAMTDAERIEKWLEGAHASQCRYGAVDPRSALIWECTCPPKFKTLREMVRRVLDVHHNRLMPWDLISSLAAVLEEKR